MDKENIEIVRRWFKKAESDLATISNNLNSPQPPTDTICFHAEQAIEKYVKGTLIFFGEHVTKTHDLVALLTKISRHIPELNGFENDFDEISHYGVEVRYPDIPFEPTIEDAKRSYAIALRVKELIMKKLKDK
ncbi:MAG: DNA-binding protein [Elusimicrobia bacterium RIFOXYA2_FULL_50_26]|nr:MAG: DNA-binding protein [Elusimicrobia bacterium RIFOXYA2_FULL_50_26]OGS23837.1 MAG: DNA-binding protein [Elusimicrobia bacterium RIFOXYB2_FULL_50_12]